MRSLNFISSLCILAVNFLTTLPTFAESRLQIPPCPSGSERDSIPNSAKPLWTGCKDKNGLYQGLLIQFSNQTEVLRIAGVRNSLREGKEIRFGKPGYLEERHFQNGHLQKNSFVYKSDSSLGRLIPKTMTAQDWESFHHAADTSILKVWLSKEPESIITFEGGRMTRLQFNGKDYRFTISKDGRILAGNHAEMKNLFFTDPEALWVLNADDLKKVLLPGWGSCKKYAGPISRFGRHYDHLLYKRSPKERVHLENLKEMRDRFVKFCVPEDIMASAGVLECPPALPSTRPPRLCLIPVSDRIKIPYEPKYFKYEFTLGRTPEEFLSILLESGLLKFASDFSQESMTVNLSPQVKAVFRKTSRGILYKPFTLDNPPNEKNTNPQIWWDWHNIPGF